MKTLERTLNDGELYCDVCQKITLHVIEEYPQYINRGLRSERVQWATVPVNCKECGL